MTRDGALPRCVHVTMAQARTRGGTVLHVARQIAQAQRAFGWVPTLATPGLLPTGDISRIAVAYGKVRAHTTAEQRRDDLSGNLGRLRPIAGHVLDPAINLLLDDPPDQVLLYEGHFTCATLPRWDALRGRGTQTILYVHNRLPRRCLVPELRRLLRHADRVVFVSEALRQETSRRLGPRHGLSLEVVHNGVDEVFRRRPPTGRPDGPAVITFFGKVCEPKGAHLAVQAADWARQMSGVPVTVRVIGDGTYGHGSGTPYEQWLRGKCAELDTPVEFLPFCDHAQLAQHLMRSAAVCLPSSSETFGLAVLESMAAGVPVVCTDLPGLREVGAGAPLYRPREVGDLADAICDLLLDDALWVRHSKLGWERAQDFSWDATARALSEGLE